MAIASLVLFPSGVITLVTAFYSFGLSRAHWEELFSILPTRIDDPYLFLFIIALVTGVSGLILGIRSIRSDKRRRIGIIGTVLNAVVLGVNIMFYIIFINIVWW